MSRVSIGNQNAVRVSGISSIGHQNSSVLNNQAVQTPMRTQIHVTTSVAESNMIPCDVLKA